MFDFDISDLMDFVHLAAWVLVSAVVAAAFLCATYFFG